MSDHDMEEKEGIFEKSDLLTELRNEEKRIRQALIEIGYFAYRIRFQRGGKQSLTLKIEAREYYEEDQRLIDSEDKPPTPELSMDGISEPFKATCL